MKQRNPFAVFILTLITFGIYGIVWQVKTKNEMNNHGAQIPTAWLMIIPFVSIFWLWKYSEGVGKVTENELSEVLAFILLILLGCIGMAIVQNSFNKVTAGPAANPTAFAPASFGTPYQSTPSVDTPTQLTPPTEAPTQPTPPSSPTL